MLISLYSIQELERVPLTGTCGKIGNVNSGFILQINLILVAMKNSLSGQVCSLNSLLLWAYDCLQ